MDMHLIAFSLYLISFRFFIFFTWGDVKRQRVILLANLALGPLVFLTVDGNRFVLGPLVLDESFVLGLASVKLGEGVAVNIRGNVKCRNMILTTDYEGSLNDGVVGLAIDGGSAEDVLAGALKTVEEAA